jgi:thymidine kinase
MYKRISIFGDIIVYKINRMNWRRGENMGSNDIFRGEIFVVTGPMKVGKTGRLIDLMTAAKYSRRPIFAFKPEIDNRADYPNANCIVSTDPNGGQRIFPAEIIPTDSFEEIFHRLKCKGITDDPTKHKPFAYVGIEEIMLYNNSNGLLIQTLRKLQELGCAIAISGLDLNFRGEPFQNMDLTLALADRIEKITGYCEYKDENGDQCGRVGRYSLRLVDGKPAPYNHPLLWVGRDYEVRCLEHHFLPGKPELKR